MDLLISSAEYPDGNLYSLYKDNYEKKEKNVEDILKKATTTYESIFYHIVIIK